MNMRRQTSVSLQKPPRWRLRQSRPSSTSLSPTTASRRAPVASMLARTASTARPDPPCGRSWTRTPAPVRTERPPPHVTTHHGAEEPTLLDQQQHVHVVVGERDANLADRERRPVHLGHGPSRPRPPGPHRWYSPGHHDRRRGLLPLSVRPPQLPQRLGVTVLGEGQQLLVLHCLGRLRQHL